MDTRIPYAVRFVADFVASALEVVELKAPNWMPLSYAVTDGRVKITWPGGFRVSAKVIIHEGHYGQDVEVVELTLRFTAEPKGDQTCEEWGRRLVSTLTGWLGTISAVVTHNTTVVIDGDALQALECLESWKRNGLPTYKWEDPKHPRHNYGL